MAKRALIIGSQLRPLQAVHADVAAMATLLDRQGFGIDQRIEGDATREGILDGYKRLIRDTASGDAAVVYYSGHGGHALNANAKPGERERLQCIFPTDWSDTGDFRGILDVELSRLMADLTQKTPNVTVILDCCHASEMSRGPNPPPAAGALVPRVYGTVWAENVAEFLRKNPVDLSRVHAESNPNAVRLVAAQVDRSAYEGDVEDGGRLVRRGFFTFELQRVLSEPSGTFLSWRTIVNRVRELVLARVSMQRPTVEGPADRLAFTTEVTSRPDAVAYFERDGEAFLRANRLLGANVGAVYAIMPFGVTDRAKATPVAMATVVELVGLDARVEVKPTPDNAAPEPGSLAFPEKLPYPPLPVVVEGDDPALIRDLINNIRFATEDVAGSAARIKVVAGRSIEIYAEGRLVAKPQANDENGRKALAERLLRWSKAESLRTLETSGLRHDAVALAWGRVEAGAEIPHAPDERYHVGDSYYVTFKNQTDVPLYVAVFDIGLGGKVTLLTSSSPGGRHVAPHGASRLPLLRDGVVRGLSLTWAPDVPDDGERRESFVVVAATKPTAFESLETPPETRRGPNRLEDLLASFRNRTTRDAAGEGTAEEGFWVGTIDFDLVPTPRSAFVVDRSLDARDYAGALTAVPRLAGALRSSAPARVALRVNEVTIHDNRALWGRSRVRLDALVLTGAGEDHTFRAATAYFPRIADGEPLPLEDLLVYEGPVGRFLDLGIWISRDEKESRTLQELLDASAQDDKFHGALTTLAALAVAAPQAAAIAGAGLAVGTVVSFASKLIGATVGSSIGLYRRSFLAHEGFGLGRHPASGARRAQDFSFAYSIEAVE